MGFFGSGDKKQSNEDYRAGVSDSGILAQGAAAVFNGGGGAKAVTSNLLTNLAIVALAIVVIWLAFRRN